MIETVIALLMIVDHEIKEHRIQPNMSECLKGKRIANRNVSDNCALVSKLFNLSITPKYAQAPIATAATIASRFLIGKATLVFSFIFIKYW